MNLLLVSATILRVANTTQKRATHQDCSLIIDYSIEF